MFCPLHLPLDRLIICSWGIPALPDVDVYSGIIIVISSYSYKQSNVGMIVLQTDNLKSVLPTNIEISIIIDLDNRFNHYWPWTLQLQSLLPLDIQLQSLLTLNITIAIIIATGHTIAIIIDLDIKVTILLFFDMNIGTIIVFALRHGEGIKNDLGQKYWTILALEYSL